MGVESVSGDIVSGDVGVERDKDLPIATVVEDGICKSSRGGRGGREGR